MTLARSIRAIALCALFASGLAGAQTYGTVPKDSAVSEPLRDVPVNVRSEPLADGEVTHQAHLAMPVGEAPVTVRTIQPNSVVGDYKIDFAALDTDGDGFISREEAQANPALADEFDSLDTARRGKLGREQLAGWLK